MMRWKTKGEWDEGAIKDFLLNKLTDSERTHIETKYFRNREYQDQVLAVEQDLVLAYLRDELSVADRQGFETGLQTSERRKALLEATRQLMSAAGRYPPEMALSPASQPRLAWRRFFAFRWAAAASLAAITLLLGLGFQAGWFSTAPKPDGQIARNPVEAASPAPVAGPNAEPPSAAPPSQPSVALSTRRLSPRPATTVPTPTPNAARAYDYSLDVAIARDGDNPTVEIPISRQAEVLNLTLTNVSFDYASYRIRLKFMDGREVLQRDHVKLRRQRTQLQIPAESIRENVLVMDIYGLGHHNEATPVSQLFLHIGTRP